MKKYNESKAYVDVNSNIISLTSSNSGLLITKDILNSLDLYLCPIISNNLIGYINDKAQVVISPAFTEVFGSFVNKEDLVVVAQDNKKGIINSEGLFVLPCIYKEIFLTGKIAVLIDVKNRRGVINVETGEEVVCFGKYRWIDKGFKNGYARVILSNHKPETQSTWNELLTAEDYPEHFVRFKSRTDSWGVIDETGKLVIPARYDRLGSLYERNGELTIQAEWTCVCLNNDGKEYEMELLTNPLKITNLFPIPKSSKSNHEHCQDDVAHDGFSIIDCYDSEGYFDYERLEDAILDGEFIPDDW